MTFNLGILCSLTGMKRIVHNMSGINEKANMKKARINNSFVMILNRYSEMD